MFDAPYSYGAAGERAVIMPRARFLAVRNERDGVRSFLEIRDRLTPAIRRPDELDGAILGRVDGRVESAEAAVI